MLEIKGVDKYFNRGKKNQIHVINQTTLTLNENGLVALLGPSGCGKTTLLNVIGGLDKIKKGNIYINHQLVSSRWSRKVDKIRNLNVGYIFQDYKLIENLSVYENVAIVLKMIGIKDKVEIHNRVEYVLDKVGMLRYQKRPANMLSGGERQRVGIARAIVKDPNIILADEPTGNLDSKNTLEIMNIIKAISRDRLVILVTHEQNLAKFYASRIIEIEDGTIKNDYENVHDGELDYEIDNRFYLKDFKNSYSLGKNNDQQKIQIYSDEEESFHLNIVIKNGNLYIQSKDCSKIEVVDETSSIEFIDGHYKKIDQEQVKRYQFPFQEIINQNVKKKYSSVVHPIGAVIDGIKNVIHFPILKKILLVGFFLAGMFIMYSTSTIAATLNIKEKDFVDTNKNYLILNKSKLSKEEYETYEREEFVDYLLVGDSKISLTLPLDDYYQSQGRNGYLNGSLSSIETIGASDLILGRMPENEQEIVVDGLAITKMYQESETFQMIGLKTSEDLLNKTVHIPNMKEFMIVGITNQESPCIYMNPSLFTNVLANTTNRNNNSYYSGYYEDTNESGSANEIVDYAMYHEKIELKKGRMPENDYEAIVNIMNEEEMPINKQIKKEVNGTKLTVVGYYSSKDGTQFTFVNQNTIRYSLIEKTKSIAIYPKDKEKAIAYFKNLKLNIRDSYEQSKMEYMEKKKDEMKSTLLVSGIILAISLIEIFLMIRSSFLSRIKEIGTLRAIGVKKSDIYKMFTGEIVAITTLAGLPGLLLMAYILSVLSGIQYLSRFFMINSWIIVSAIIFVYLFNIMIGLIPVYNTIRKRPAEILARYDLD